MAHDVADAINWEIEAIPDQDRLYMRIHRQYINPDGTLQPGAFRDHGGSMSTDWNKYRSAQDTLKDAKEPSINAVISMNVGEIRLIPGQAVQHDPMPDNRAHTGVIGPKTTKERVLYTDIYRFEIYLADQL